MKNSKCQMKYCPTETMRNIVIKLEDIPLRFCTSFTKWSMHCNYRR